MSDQSLRAGWQPATYYPDPAIHALDPRFEKYWLKLSAVERLTTGMRWAEGPVWFGDGRYLLCSDIPNNRILKWEEETGAVSIYRKPSNFANGHTRDRQGRLVGCEHGGRHVIPRGNDRRMPSANCHVPTSSSSASRKFAAFHACTSRGIPLLSDRFPA